MKKVFLGIFTALSALSVSAAVETKIIPDAAIVSLSPDGQYATSEFYGTMVIYDLDTDDHYDYFESETKEYGVGHGNNWGDGAMVGFMSNSGVSAVWRKGRWTALPLAAPDPAGMGIANGITKDLSRICGNASTGSGLALDEDRLMVYPCYWDINANGTSYGKQTSLPYPTTDFIGQTPQYVTALCIADDGKTIWGQITSGNGFFHEPIVYKQAEDGTWTYELPLRSQALPEGVKVVPYPGDGPNIPSMESFMTEAELEAYDKAYQIYAQNPDAYPVPKYENFMTAEEIAAYNKAIEPRIEWEEKYAEYEAMLQELMAKGLTFCFNLVRISPNGRYVAMASEKLYPTSEGGTQSMYSPYLYDTVTGEGKSIGIDGYSMLVTAVNNDGEVLGYQDAGGADLGLVYRVASDSWISYTDYLKSRDASLGEWIEKNWKHEVEVELDPTTGETDFVELEISGRPFVSADWNTFSSVAYNFWGGEYKNMYVNYVVRFNVDSSIGEVNASASDSVRYYDLQGRRIAAPAHGIFIKRQGSESVKVAL